MKREEKEQVVQVLHGELEKSQAVFVTDYMGLNVERITKLRRDIAGAGGSYQVVKNTLLRRASEGTPVAGIEQFFVGPTAVAIARSDAVAVAKALVNFARDNDLPWSIIIGNKNFIVQPQSIDQHADYFGLN